MGKFFNNLIYTGFTLNPSLSLAQLSDHDTIKVKELHEVVVQAQMQRTSVSSTTYTPTGKQKSAALNTIDLLNNMAIPQIVVMPSTGNILTNNGNEVKVFIDYELASDTEKDGLNPNEVKKVEYLIYPVDPRFGNHKYVINIILNHYNYGGYFKATGVGNILIGSGSWQLYLKNSFKRMTYDLNFYDKYTDRSHTGTEQNQQFRFPLSDGFTNELNRSASIADSHYQQNYCWGSLRAKYNSEKSVISNTIYLISNNTPHNDYFGKVIFNENVHNTESPYSHYIKIKNINPHWRNNSYFDLGKDFLMSLNVDYKNIISDRTYQSEKINIVTDAHENMLDLNLDLDISKKNRQ